jgi:SAM-dependent methyltransferase
LGYDISVSHIRLANEYVQQLNIKNISFSQIVGPQDIKNLPKVDLVFTVIVLQHNPPPIIRLIIQELIRALKKGGIAFFQVPTYRLGYKFSLKDYLEKGVEGDHIEMHLLPQHEIFDIISRENAKVIELLDDAWAGLRKGDRSNTFVVQKL